MLITLKFLVVAKKSRTFFSFSYSANEQVCGSWIDIQARQTDIQARQISKLANGNIPYHKCHTQFTKRG